MTDDFKDAGSRAMTGLNEIIYREKNPNIRAVETLNVIIAEFESRLTNETDLGAYIAGAASPVHIVRITSRNPHMLVFDGINEDGDEIVAIQHFSQLNIQLVKLKKREESPYRVGFIVQSE